jgi:hypothetical protein
MKRFERPPGVPPRQSSGVGSQLAGLSVKTAQRNDSKARTGRRHGGTNDPCVEVCLWAAFKTCQRVRSTTPGSSAIHSRRKSPQ